MTKTNIGPPAQSLAFRLHRAAGNGETTVEWTGPLDLSANDLCGGGSPLRAGRQSRVRAVEWLRQFLADGPCRVPEIQAAARTAGFAERTLDRAKEVLGVLSEAIHHEGKTEWQWRDPSAPKPAPVLGRAAAATRAGAVAGFRFALPQGDLGASRRSEVAAREIS